MKWNNKKNVQQDGKLAQVFHVNQKKASKMPPLVAKINTVCILCMSNCCVVKGELVETRLSGYCDSQEGWKYHVQSFSLVALKTRT